MVGLGTSRDVDRTEMTYRSEDGVKMQVSDEESIDSEPPEDEEPESKAITLQENDYPAARKTVSGLDTFNPMRQFYQ